MLQPETEERVPVGLNLDRRGKYEENGHRPSRHKRVILVPSKARQKIWRFCEVSNAIQDAGASCPLPVMRCRSLPWQVDSQGSSKFRLRSRLFDHAAVIGGGRLHDWRATVSRAECKELEKNAENLARRVHTVPVARLLFLGDASPCFRKGCDTQQP
jgi:hypothetical protein